MTAVREIRALRLRVPLPRPVRNGTATIADRDYVLVQVTADDGSTGVGHALGRGLDVAGPVRDLVAPALVGVDTASTGPIVERLRAELAVHGGRSGPLVRALSVVDVALWDLRARQAGLPVAALLGGWRPQVPAMVASGYYREGETAESLVDTYARHRDEGWQLAKAMAGALPPAADAARLAAAQRGFGDRPLAVDVNGAWTSTIDADRFLDALDVEPFFVEEPFAPEQLEPLRRLRAARRVRVAVGEWDCGRRAFLRLLQAGAVDVVRADVTAVGGVTEWLAVASLAAAYDVPLLPHYYPELHAHLAAAVPGVLAVEVVPMDSGADNLHVLQRTPLGVAGGQVLLPDRPGWGVEWDWDAVERWTVRSGS